MSVTFKEELRTSNLSIDELLKKHNLNLKQVLKQHTNAWGHKKKVYENIYKHGNGFQIQKKSIYYGSYNSLEDAKKVRDKLIEYDWDKNQLKNVLEDVGVSRHAHYSLWNNTKASYHKYQQGTRLFRVRFGKRSVNIGYFLDPVTCEVVYDLISDAVGE